MKAVRANKAAQRQQKERVQGKQTKLRGSFDCVYSLLKSVLKNIFGMMSGDLTDAECLNVCLNSTNVVMNYSEIESKVREATNDDPWGPSGQLMGEIAKYV